ncbi:MULTISPECIES: hypothetical protein [Okeania]|nr:MULTISPECIES: hypothetical protein [unclassified Okeania]
MSKDTLSYLGPTEFLVNQPTIITSKFNPEQIHSIALLAEDKYFECY